MAKKGKKMNNQVLSNTEERTERRKSQRIRACFTVVYKLSKQVEILMWLEGKEVSAIMIDLSQDGMAILTEKNIPALSVLAINFNLINEFEKKENQEKPMELEGEVRYNIFLQERAYRLGISFTKISKKDKDEITNFINMTKAWDPKA